MTILEPTIAIAADHAGYDLKQALLQQAREQLPAIRFQDLGTDSSSKSVDYPGFAQAVCESVSSGDSQSGILICGTGNGMVMAANRYAPTIRAALCHNQFSVQLAREHNDANILCLGSWFVTERMSLELLKLWIHTSFHGERHLRRIEQFSKIKS